MHFSQKTKLISLFILFFPMLIMAETPNFRMVGFATTNGGTTGGTAGETVTPNTFEELKQYIEAPTTPYIIRITKEFTTGVTTWVDESGAIVTSNDTGALETTFGAIFKIGSNKTVLGIDDKAFFNRIGLVIQCSSNIIIRNIKFTMKSVPATRDGEYKILDTDGITTVGDPDCIGIQADAESVPEANRISQHIWIDHCEFYNENTSNKDRYDGLIDNKNNVQNMTISWCYFHDHSKALLSGKGSSDDYNRTITYHHNYFSQIFGSRLPLLRFGQHHYFNNFMENCEGDGVNMRINSNCYIENVYFKDSKKPVFGKLSENGQAILINNIFENCSRLPAGITNLNDTKSSPLSSSEDFLRACNFTPSELYDYNDVLDSTINVPAIVKAYSGIGKLSQVIEGTPISTLKNQHIYTDNNGIVIDVFSQTSVIIYDLNGKAIYRNNVTESITKIALSKHGTYIVQLASENQNKSYKVVY